MQSVTKGSMILALASGFNIEAEECRWKVSAMIAASVTDLSYAV